MTGSQRKWDRLSEDQRKTTINELIYFFESERDEIIGVVAAEQILNFFLQSAGPAVYNKGLEDAKTAFEKRYEEFRYDIDELFDF